MEELPINGRNTKNTLASTEMLQIIAQMDTK
jgi:hypothetical protein